MSKVLPFIVGIIIGFGVMFIIQFIRKKRVPEALIEF